MDEQRSLGPAPAADARLINSIPRQPHAWIITAAVGHTIEHASQSRQFVTDRTMASEM